jgi:hypothetical protein
MLKHGHRVQEGQLYPGLATIFTENHFNLKGQLTNQLFILGI